MMPVWRQSQEFTEISHVEFQQSHDNPWVEIAVVSSELEVSPWLLDQDGLLLDLWVIREHRGTVSVSSWLCLLSALLLSQLHWLLTAGFTCVLTCILDVFYFVHYLVLLVTCLVLRKTVWKDLLVWHIVGVFLFLHLLRISLVLFWWNLTKISLALRLVILRQNHVFLGWDQSRWHLVRGRIPEVLV